MAPNSLRCISIHLLLKTFLAFVGFLSILNAATASSPPDNSIEALANSIAEELVNGGNFRSKKDKSSEAYEIEKEEITYSPRLKNHIHSQENPHKHKRNQKHKKSGRNRKSGHISRKEKKRLMELRKQQQALEDLARLQAANRFYYFNEQLPATRNPTAYDSLLNITSESPAVEHVSSRRDALKDKSLLWEPLAVDTKAAPFHFHMPILTGNSIADPNVDFKQILSEATKYKNPLDFFFLLPSQDKGKDQKEQSSTVSTT